MKIPDGSDPIALQKFLSQLLVTVQQTEAAVTAVAEEQELEIGKTESSLETEYTKDDVAFLRLSTIGVGISYGQSYSGLRTTGFYVDPTDTTETLPVSGTVSGATVTGTATLTHHNVGTGSLVTGTWIALGSVSGRAGRYAATLFRFVR